jgi:penicillin-binding protein 1A
VPRHLRWFVYPFIVLLGLAAIVTALVGIVVILAYPQLPSLEALTDYRPKIPLRVYSADHRLIGEFGEERRDVVAIKDVPEFMKQAIIAAEDERFYQHPGIDLHGILRAAWSNLVTRGRHQGASTITMQVARNFFLSRERTLTRKIYEALLAFKIENNLGKDDILQLYINQIYLGQHAYGFSSAAQIYFGKSLKELSIAEAAMLATLPQAPSAHNPVVNFDRARLRQLHVLHKMLELGFIDATDAQAAEAETLHIKHYSNDFGVHADYVLVKTAIARVTRSSPQSTLPTRKLPTKTCARACSITTDATATAAPKTMSTWKMPPPARMNSWKNSSPTSTTPMTCWRPLFLTPLRLASGPTCAAATPLP